MDRHFKFIQIIFHFERQLDQLALSLRSTLEVAVLTALHAPLIPVAVNVRISGDYLALWILHHRVLSSPNFQASVSLMTDLPACRTLHNVSFCALICLMANLIAFETEFGGTID